jgi:hypothetical protein
MSIESYCMLYTTYKYISMHIFIIPADLLVHTSIRPIVKEIGMSKVDALQVSIWRFRSLRLRKVKQVD